MEPQEVVQAFYSALANSGPEAAAEHFADNFMFEEAGGLLQDKKQWLAQQEMWRTGFPDLKISYEVQSVEGNRIHGTRRFSGTHTGDLDLESLGLGIVPATGKSVSITEAVVYLVLDESVISCHSAPGEGGGIHGVLAQLGIEMP